MKRLSLIGVLMAALLPLGCAHNYSSNNYNPNYYPYNSTYRTTYYVPPARHHHHHHHDGGHHDGGHHGSGHH